MYKYIKIIIESDTSINLIQIYDSDNKIVDELYINNEYIFKAKLNNYYKIRIVSYDKTMFTSFFVSDKYNGLYVFNLKNQLSHEIFIYLLDKNYDGLKVMKGEINLWQNHTI